MYQLVPTFMLINRSFGFFCVCKDLFLVELCGAPPRYYVKNVFGLRLERYEISLPLLALSHTSEDLHPSHLSLDYRFTVQEMLLLLAVESLEIFIHHLCAPPFLLISLMLCELLLINAAPGRVLRLFCRAASSRMLARRLFQRAKKISSHTSI